MLQKEIKDASNKVQVCCITCMYEVDNWNSWNPSLETKQNKTKRNETKRNEVKQSEVKRSKTKQNKTKQEGTGVGWSI